MMNSFKTNSAIYLITKNNTMKFFLYTIILSIFSAINLYAQHDSSMPMHHDMHNMNDTTPPKMNDMPMHKKHDMMMLRWATCRIRFLLIFP